MNIAVVRGVVVREPQERELSSGRMVSLDVSVSYEEGPAETVEVVWLDAPNLSKLPRQGMEVFVAGRVRRRFFKTASGLAAKTELVADTVLTASKKRQIQRRLEMVVADVEEV
jgi:hypothetical protein